MNEESAVDIFGKNVILIEDYNQMKMLKEFAQNYWQYLGVI